LHYLLPYVLDAIFSVVQENTSRTTLYQLTAQNLVL
jgi:hypothetical protein